MIYRERLKSDKRKTMEKTHKILIWVCAVIFLSYPALFAGVRVVPWLWMVCTRNTWSIREAIYERDVEIVKKRLAQQKNINEIDKNGDTLLINAVLTQRRETPSFVSSEAWSKRKLMIIELLLDHGADPNIQDKQDGRTPLIWAVYYGLKATEVLLEKGVNPNTKNREGQTPLHVAVERGSFTCIKPLIEHGADVNAKDSAGHTPLHNALERGFEPVIRELRESGGIDE